MRWQKRRRMVGAPNLGGRDQLQRSGGRSETHSYSGRMRVPRRPGHAFRVPIPLGVFRRPAPRDQAGPGGYAEKAQACNRDLPVRTGARGRRARLGQSGNARDHLLRRDDDRRHHRWRWWRSSRARRRRHDDDRRRGHDVDSDRRWRRGKWRRRGRWRRRWGAGAVITGGSPARAVPVPVEAKRMAPTPIAASPMDAPARAREPKPRAFLRDVTSCLPSRPAGFFCASCSPRNQACPFVT